MSISKARSKYQKYSYAIILPAMFFSLAGCQLQTAEQAKLQKQTEKMIYESDLRAFCPPVKLDQNRYFYNIYSRGASSAANILYQSSITDITRDCRYDHQNGIVAMNIAAAGRVVTGSGNSNKAVKLPITINITNGDKTLFNKTYQQNISTQQAGGATQFLFSEKVNLQQADVVKGTEIVIGFATTGEPPKKAVIIKAPSINNQTSAAASENGQKPILKQTPDRLSPNSGSITIPESW